MLRTIHKYAGLLLGLLLTLIGFSGSLLVFDHAIDDQITPELRSLSSQSSAPLQRVLQNAMQAAPPRTQASRIDLARQPGAPHMVRFTCTQNPDCRIDVSIDPQTGRVLTVREWGAYTMSWIYVLHYTLLSGSTGKTIVGLTGIALIFFLVSGLYLWWPKRGRLRQALRIRRHPTGRFLRELHQVIGAITAPALLICAITGVTLVFYTQVRATINFFSPVTSKPLFTVSPLGPTLTIDELFDRAQTVFPKGVIKRIYLPKAPNQPVQVRLNLPDEPWINHGASAVWINPYNGSILGTWNAADLPPGNTILTWAFPLHNADVLGLAGRFFWVFTGLLPGFLFITGAIFWYWKKRRKTVPGKQSLPSA